MEHLGTRELETRKLILRRFTINDTASVYNNWANDDSVTHFLSWPTHKDINVTKNVLENWIENYSKKDFYQWAIVPKEANEPIGTISVAGKNDDIKMVAIGYCIGKQWWNKGITSEALNAIIKFFFEEVSINRIESWHDPNNQNSGKVMAKCGMKYEGHLRQADKNNTGICDRIVYAVLSEEYRKKRLKIDMEYIEKTEDDNKAVSDIINIINGWGSDILVTRGNIYKAKDLDGVLVYENGKIIGLGLYKIANDCEIILLETFIQNKGIGTKIIERIKEIAKIKECKRVWLITSNENINAIKFYQKRGFHISNIYINAIEEARKINPEIPMIANGIEIRDEIEFEINI